MQNAQFLPLYALRNFEKTQKTAFPSDFAYIWVFVYFIYKRVLFNFLDEYIVLFFTFSILFLRPTVTK